MNQQKLNNIFYIILIALVCIVIYKLYNKQENFTETVQSNEGVQNIASVYADTTGTVGFNNVNITGNFNVTGKFNMLPTGSIIMWNGNTAPSGWALCDGTQNTPDLRGRFVLGQNPYNGGSANNGSCNSSGYPNINTGARVSSDLCHAIGINGGEAYHTLTTNEIPQHTHNVIANQSNSQWTGSNAQAWGLLGSPAYSPTAPTDGGTGGGSSHNTIPPYYVLAFIMKL